VEHLVEQVMVSKVEVQHLAWSLQPQLAVALELVVALKMVVLVALVVVVLVVAILELVHQVKEMTVVVVQTIQVQKV
jgi:flagellar biosynthesis protein FliQ